MTKSIKTDNTDELGNLLYGQEAKSITSDELKKLFEDFKEVITISFQKSRFYLVKGFKQ